MNPNRSSFARGPCSGAEDDSEVVRVLDAYLSGIEAGQPADPDKLLADHPALAGPVAGLPESHEPGRAAGGGCRRPSRGRARRTHQPTARLRPGSSLLSTLDLGPGPPPQIHLHELPDEREPLVMPRSAEMPDRRWRGAGPLPASGRDRPGRHGRDPQGSRRRPGARAGDQGAARVAPGRSRGRAPIRRGGADRRPVAAPGDRAGLRAGHVPRPAPVFRHEAGQGPDPGGALGRAQGRPRRGSPPCWTAGSVPAQTDRGTHDPALPDRGSPSVAAMRTCPGSCRSSSRSARRWPMPTPAA